MGKLKCLLSNFVFFVIPLFFLTSCGLDTYIVVDSPTNVINPPSYTTEDYNNECFEFWTNDSGVASYPSDFKYLGTQVYYKIYGSSSTLASEVSYLQNLANDSENSARAPDKLLNPTSSGGYGYQALQSTNVSDSSVLIPYVDGKLTQNVYIRLTDYQNLEEFSARILVDGKFLGGSSVKTVPVRFENDLSFNFGRTGENDKKPVPYDSSTGEGDLDVKGPVPSDGVWYVAMFAVGVGRDVTYTMQYSNILYLGSVAIDSNSVDN